MRISDWSSDVCSSDLLADLRVEDGVRRLAGQIVDDLDILTAGVEDLEHRFIVDEEVEQRFQVDAGRHRVDRSGMEIGRASCRGRVCHTCRSRWSPYH